MSADLKGQTPKTEKRGGIDGCEQRKRLLLLASKLGYQTRSFAEAAKRVGAEVVLGTDRCHQIDDPWADGAIAVHFDDPEKAAQSIIEKTHGAPVTGVLALGDRPTETAAYVARALGLPYSSPKRCAIAAASWRSAKFCRPRGCRCRPSFPLRFRNPSSRSCSAWSFPAW